MAPLRYMLDTNVVSILIRHPDGALAARVAALPQGSYAISVIVAGELRYGGARRNSARLSRQVDAVLGALDVRPLAEPADHLYGRIRSEMEETGLPIGPNDLLIAAHARALGATLVTRNVREFRRVPGLPVEDWQTAGPFRK